MEEHAGHRATSLSTLAPTYLLVRRVCKALSLSRSRSLYLLVRRVCKAALECTACLLERIVRCSLLACQFPRGDNHGEMQHKEDREERRDARWVCVCVGRNGVIEVGSEEYVGASA